MRMVILFTFSVLLCSGIALAADSANPEDKRLNAFFQEEWDWAMKQSPTTATLVGDYRYNSELGDYSLASVKRQEQHERDALKKLESFDRT